MAHGTDHKKELNRLKRIEGQVRGVANMVERQEYCIDILHQVRAIRSSLKSFEVSILEKHLDHCVRDAFDTKASGSDTQKKIDEILELFRSLK